MIGGNYNAAAYTNTTPFPYARLFDDEGGVFSQYNYYDRLGRLVVSQNTKQHNYAREAYSYTLYDALNRITEVGQKTENNFKQDTLFSTIFGDTIMGFHNPLAISPTNFLTWVTDGSGYRTQVNRTYYDVQAILPQSVLQQQELRNRVASTIYSDTLWTDTFKFNNATHYSYDVHGNVKTLIQDDSVIGIPGERYKRVDYQYDLVSGKVNQVDYENDSLDAYHQIYQYDADNRITSVFTSRDSILWDNDANYFYYAHGPLGREEIGDQQVQGIDYAYTLQGWLKGVNSDLLDSNRDMGNDGLQNATNLNRYFAQDAFGYSLKYFTGDYNAINQTIWNDNVSKFEANYYNSDLMNSRHDLFNGNITAMVTDIQQPQAYSQTIANQNTIPLPQGTAYNYDQLNRLIEMYAFQNLDTSNSWENTGVYNGSFNNWFTYDENGNILTQKRADQLGNVFDSLSYNYNVQSGLALQNRLYGVNNAVSIANSMPDDGPFSDALSTINQVNNYRYTAMGELAEDITGQLDTVVWNVYGKVWRIKQRNGDSLTFFYDTKGDRIEKDYYTARPVSDVKTYYVRDAQGNILAIYTAQGGAPIVGTLGTGISSTSTPIIKYTLAERDIYGSKRIGADFTPVQLIGALPVSMIDTFGRYLGMKQYEMDNHLGNVLATVSDRKIPISLDTTTGTAIDHYEADVLSSQDYYGFGMEEPGRNFNSTSYRFGFNGKLKDDETYGDGNEYDYGARIYDPRLGKFFTKDALEKTAPSISPFAFSENNPIIGKDADGNVVIFINGQNSGSGGQRSYWGGYDTKMMEQLKDHSSRYVDGSMGGWSNTTKWATIGALFGGGAFVAVATWSNVNMQVRIKAGEAQGIKDAPSIIAGLKPGETIKIVTHSMGTAYARGYVKGLLEYAEEHPPGDKIKIDYELDVNAFQSSSIPPPTLSKNGVADSKTGGDQLVPSTGTAPPGTTDISSSQDAKTGHAIKDMSSDITNSAYKPDAKKGDDSPGKGDVQYPNQEGNNNENTNPK